MIRIALCAILLFCTQDALSQSIVKDINAVPRGSSPGYHTATSNGVVFTADTPETGRALWVTDGTVNGTAMLRDFAPGPEQSAVFFLQSWGDDVLFYESETQKIHVTDGTSSGTIAVDGFSGPMQPQTVIATDKSAFIVRQDKSNNPILYIPKESITAVPVDFGCCLDNNASVYSTVFYDGDFIYARLSGTNTSSVLVKISLDGLSVTKLEVDPSGWWTMLGVSNGKPIFIRRESEMILALYSWSPDTGEVRLKEVSDASRNGDYFAVGSASGRLIIFSAQWSGPPTYIGTDGTVEGTEVIITLPNWPSWDGGISLGDKLLLSIETEEMGKELWSTDGTAAGTKLVKDIYPGSKSGEPERMRLVGNEVYFCANDGVNGVEIWKSDGTPEGTFLVADIFEGPGSSRPAWAVSTSRGLVLSATTSNGGNQTVLVDPDTGGHIVLGILGHLNTENSSPESFVGTPESVIFKANDGIHGEALWSTDGLEEGTVFLENIQNGFLPSSTNTLGWFENKHYWSQNSDLITYDLNTKSWERTPLGIGTISSAHMGVSGNEQAIVFYATDNIQSFWVRDSSTGTLQQVWSAENLGNSVKVLGFIGDNWVVQVGARVYSITASGQAVLLSEAAASSPMPGVTLDDRVVYFSGERGMSTDGTIEGTDPSLNVFNSNQNLVRVGSKAVFSGVATGFGRELLATDGTLEGTSVVKDIRPGVAGSTPHDIFEANGRIYFSAINEQSKRTLWVSDGSESGTTELWSDFGSSSPNELDFLILARFDGKFLFTMNHPSFGRELWMSDGTSSGTKLIADLVPGSVGSNPKEGGVSDQYVFFSASIPGTGREPWKIDRAYLSTSREQGEIPEHEFTVSPVYPNPFSESGRVALSVSKTEHVDVALYDIIGRRVQVLFQGTLSPGISKEVKIDGQRLAPGLYVVKMTSPSQSKSVTTVRVR